MKVGMTNLKYEVHEKDGEWEVKGILEPTSLEKKKAFKEFHKLSATAIIDGVRFQIDVESINFMAAIVALSNANKLDAMAGGATAAEAKSAVDATMINWKDARNDWVSVSLGGVRNALQASMTKLAEILAKY